MKSLSVETILEHGAQRARERGKMPRVDVCHAEKGAAMAFSDAYYALQYQIGINEQMNTPESLALIPGMRAAMGVIRDLSDLALDIAEETISAADSRVRS